jgi:hypothetical protein
MNYQLPIKRKMSGGWGGSIRDSDSYLGVAELKYEL